MRTAFTELLGVPHPIAGFNRSAPGGVPAAEIARQIISECEQRIVELGALL